MRMRCMDFAHGPAVYSSDVGHRTYDIAGLWRAVLDSVLHHTNVEEPFECEEVMVGRNGGYLFRLETHTRVLSH